LGMADTGYILPESKVSRLVHIHKYEDDDSLSSNDLENTYNTTRPKFIAGGGGLMLSTVKDYWRFSQMILNGGEFEGKRILKKSTAELMHINALAPGIRLSVLSPDVNGVGFGFGFAIVQDPTAAKIPVPVPAPADSFWWSGFFGTWFWIDPVNSLIVIGFLNKSNTYRSPVGQPDMLEIAAKHLYGALKGSN